MSINYWALTSGALAFTVALAWNEAFSQTIHSLIKPTDARSSAQASMVYALLITICVIVLVATINRAHRFVFKSRRPDLGAFTNRSAAAPLVRI